MRLLCITTTTSTQHIVYTLQSFDMAFSVGKWNELCVEMDSFEQYFHEQFGCETGSLTLEDINLRKCRKETICNWLVKLAATYNDCKVLTTSAATKIEELTSQLSKKQEKVIALQEDIIAFKDEQLVAVQTTVRDQVASVQTAVKTDISSWAKLVQQNTSEVITPAKLQEAVKSVVAEEDRSQNVMIFGKEEKKNEDLCQIVSEILEDVNEKPRVIECRRVGTVTSGKPRPIKCKLSSSDAVYHVLRKSKDLKSSERNRRTFLSPDRTIAERHTHNALVQQMKEKMKMDPEMYHYIKGGLIFSVKKSANGTTE